jgi:DNA repair exonuclease SbcCD ATPase subunit
MVRRLYAAGILALGLAVVSGAAAGQGGTGKGTAEPAGTGAELRELRAELAKTRAELRELRADLAKLRQALKAVVEKVQGPRALNYLEELEKLEALRLKGVVNALDFKRLRVDILARHEKPQRPLSPMADLDRQLRDLGDLLAKGRINLAERDRKRAELVQRPLTVADLKTDLEMVRRLHDDGIITITQRDTLKRALLGGPDKGK